MVRWTWTQRKFNFDFPEAKMPDLLERVRGTPARIEERVHGLGDGLLSATDGGWSIKQNIGHLVDLGYLPLQRIQQILAGEPTLIAADITNRQTHEADHNAKPIAKLIAEFRQERAKLVERLESLSEGDWGKSAIHPRIKQPMRIVDIAYFDSEHDDYHLARIGELIRKLST